MPKSRPTSSKNSGFSYSHNTNNSRAASATPSWIEIEPCGNAAEERLCLCRDGGFANPGCPRVVVKSSVVPAGQYTAALREMKRVLMLNTRSGENYERQANLFALANAIDRVFRGESVCG